MTKTRSGEVLFDFVRRDSGILQLIEKTMNLQWLTEKKDAQQRAFSVLNANVPTHYKTGFNYETPPAPFSDTVQLLTAILFPQEFGRLAVEAFVKKNTSIFTLCGTPYKTLSDSALSTVSNRMLVTIKKNPVLVAWGSFPPASQTVSKKYLSVPLCLKTIFSPHCDPKHSQQIITKNNVISLLPSQNKNNSMQNYIATLVLQRLLRQTLDEQGLTTSLEPHLNLEFIQQRINAYRKKVEALRNEGQGNKTHYILGQISYLTRVLDRSPFGLYDLQVTERQVGNKDAQGVYSASLKGVDVNELRQAIEAHPTYTLTSPSPPILKPVLRRTFA
jgi:hypothetical protein